MEDSASSSGRAEESKRLPPHGKGFPSSASCSPWQSERKEQEERLWKGFSRDSSRGFFFRERPSSELASWRSWGTFSNARCRSSECWPFSSTKRPPLRASASSSTGFPGTGLGGARGSCARSYPGASGGVHGTALPTRQHRHVHGSLISWW